MGLEKSKMLDTWPPGVHQEVDHLVGWERQQLCQLFEDFRMLPQMSVNFADFFRLLRWPKRAHAEAAFELFEPRQGRVQYLTIIGPMVVMSDQHFISRSTMLFSMFDFNSEGMLNRAELVIGFRALLKGCAVFWQGFAAPSAEEVESLATSLFTRIDSDASELITLGEFLCFAYRSRGLRTLMSPYPSSRQQIHEEPIRFAGRGKELDVAVQRTAKQLERKTRHQIRLTPDAPDDLDSKRWVRKKDRGCPRKKPWRQPANVTRAHAWLVLRLFRKLAKGERTVQVSDLLRVISDDARAALAVEDAARIPLEGPEATCTDVPEGVQRIVSHFCVQLSGGHTRTRAETLCDDGGCSGLSLRAFVCILWPHLKESDLETCLGWCKGYQAHMVLQELLKAVRNEDFDLDAEDLGEMFDALDANGDGEISVEELTRIGKLDVQSARRLSAKMDADGSGQLSKAEVRAVVQQLDDAFKQQLKAMFATSQMQ